MFSKVEQNVVYDLVWCNVLVYDQCYGYCGLEGFVELFVDVDEWEDVIDQILVRYLGSDNLIVVVVIEVFSKCVCVELVFGDMLEIKGDGLCFVVCVLQLNVKLVFKICVGLVICVSQDSKGWWLIVQMLEVDVVFVVLNVEDGFYWVMVGGFDFFCNQFNYVINVWCQLGLSIKFFVYLVVLEKGFLLVILMNDVLFLLFGGEGGQFWELCNDDGFDGLISLCQVLVCLKNVVVVCLL